MQCWQCGAVVQPGERTCGNCGARVTSPPTGRSQRPSQQRQPPQRHTPRRSRNEEWQPDASDESDYGADYAADGRPAYNSSYPADDRRRGRQGSRPGADDGWDDDSPTPRRRPPRRRSRADQQPDGYGDYSQPGYDQSGVYDDSASNDYEAPARDPLNDPRAPSNLRATPRRGPDARGGRTPGDAPARYGRDGSRDGSRDDWQDDWEQQGSPDMADGRSLRPSADPTRDRRRDDGAYRGRDYTPEDMLPPLTQERRGQSSSADNRYGRSSGARGQSSPYSDGYGGGESDEYGARRNGPRQGYGRRMPPDERASYGQSNGQGRSWQQRWGDTISGFRIPGARPQQEEATVAKSASRRLMTTIVLIVALAVVVAGGVVVAPHIIQRLHPTTTTSPLCLPSGPDTASALPTPPAHFKQFTSARSRYGVSYPETWTVEPEQKVATGYDYIDVYTLPNSPTSVSIEQPEAACAISDINIIQGEVAAAQHQNITFAEDTTAATSQTIGGEQWQRREYEVTDSGASLHMVILACHHQGRAYVIVLVSKTTTFTTDNTGIFTPMLKSFAFQK